MSDSSNLQKPRTLALNAHRSLIYYTPEDVAQLVMQAERYLWWRATAPHALLQIAWGASRAACDIGADCDAAIDAAMGNGSQVASPGARLGGAPKKGP